MLCFVCFLVISLLVDYSTAMGPCMACILTLTRHAYKMRIVEASNPVWKQQVLPFAYYWPLHPASHWCYNPVKCFCFCHFFGTLPPAHASEVGGKMFQGPS